MSFISSIVFFAAGDEDTTHTDHGVLPQHWGYLQDRDSQTDSAADEEV